MSTILNLTNQSFRIPAPTLTEKNLPIQAGRVSIVTGGYAGIGLELTRILYSHHGIVYAAGRSREKADPALAGVRAAFPNSKGRIEFLQVDFADLTTIKKAADVFMSKETRLDVLTNNAGVMAPPVGSKSAQGYELQMATNVLGSFLFTKCLTDILIKTAATSPPGSVRVTWAASLTVDLSSPKGGVAFDETTGVPKWHSDNHTNYGQSKAANVFLASEFVKRFPLNSSKVISNCWNPGNLKSDLQRHMSGLQRMATSVMLHDTIYGAYTELFAGWSEDAGEEENNGKYIMPWGRFGGVRKDVELGLSVESEGGSGAAARLWDWCDKETKEFV